MARKTHVSGYLHESLQSLRPPEDFTVSEWAERYRVLDEKSSNIAGPWSNQMTPYLVDIMNEFNNPDTEEIIFCKPTQVGGTEAANNILGYIVGQNPSPVLVVYPSDKLGKSVSVNRLQPMFRRSPQLRERFNERRSSLLELQFDGMYIAITGTDSPSSLASRPIGNLILDEVDKYPDTPSKPSQEAIRGMHEKLMLMKDDDGNPLAASPKFILAPVGIASDIIQILGATSIAVNINGVINTQNNPLAGRGFEVVEDPFLNTLADSITWYMISDPNVLPFIQIDYLNGNEMPTIRRMEVSGQLGFVWDIWLDWGITALEYRGVIRNKGK